MLDDKPHVRALRTRIVELRAMPGFAMLDVDTLELLAESSRVRRFRRGDVLLRAGSPIEHVYMAIEGGIEVRRGGAKLDVQSFGGIGFLSLLAGDGRGVDAVAIADCRALEVPAATALRVMTESFAITRIAIRSLARQLLRIRGALPPSEPNPEALALGTRRERELTMVERLVLLRRTPLGRYANLDASAEMAREMKELRVPAGEPLWAADDPSSFWIGIEYGRVRCDAGGGHVVWVGSTRVLGVLECWGDRPRSYAAWAETDLVVHRIELATMLAIAETHPAMGVQLSRFLARDLIANDGEREGAVLRGEAGDEPPSARERRRLLAR